MGAVVMVLWKISGSKNDEVKPESTA